MPKTETAKKITNLMSKFVDVMGALTPLNVEDPLGRMLLPLLAGPGSIERARKIQAELLAQFGDYNELRVGRNSEIVPALRHMLFYSPDRATALAGNIRAMLKSIFQSQGVTDIAHLLKAKVTDQKRLVNSLEGVDKDQQTGILLLAFDHKLVPVDEPVLQILRAAKIVADSATGFQASKALETTLPREQYIDFYRYSKMLVDTCISRDNTLNLARTPVSRFIGKK